MDMYTLSKLDVALMKELAVSIVLDVGEKLHDVLGEQENSTLGNTKSSTLHDKWAEQAIVSKLQNTGIPFLGEELNPTMFNDTTWVIDPIDGTGWFMRGEPYCTTMIGLYSEDRPVFSIIHNFGLGKTLFAQQGNGCVLEDRKLTTSCRKLSESYIEIHSNDAAPEDITFKIALWKQGACLVNNAASGHSYTQLASGKLDAIVFLPSCKDKPWDYLPGLIAVIEAGGVVISYNKTLVSDELPLYICASNKVLAEELEKLLPKNYTEPRIAHRFIL
jgi:fructose-1,6-bisphosphatase/inositol monophosphatase family enzyme